MDTSAIENALYNRDKILNLELEYGVGSTGLPSDARHMAAMNELSKTIAAPISKISEPLGTFAGDTGAFLAGAINEIPGVYRSITGEAPIRDTWEDIVANWKGTFGTSNIETPEQIYKNVYGIPNTTTANRNLFTQYGYGMPERFKQQQFMNKKKQDMQRQIREAEKKQRQIREAEEKRIEQEKIKTAQDNWKPTYNPASSHAEAQATGGDYHGGHQSTVDGQTTDWGPNSAMIARGGLAQYAPRGSYFNGGLASLYRHGGF
jgi:hypothetical protein